MINHSPAPLAKALDRHRGEIEPYLYVGRAKWENLIKSIRAQEQAQSPYFANEKVWTFLFSCGYAVNGKPGIRELTRIMTGADQVQPSHPQIWFEVLPIPPRKYEGNTSVDLALGTISPRKPTKGGIQLDCLEQKTWVCFCEMKFYADIASDTTHDSQRNQLLRVIENALCFQNSEIHAERVYVTLVTPEIFRNAELKSKLYQYKFEEYQSNCISIISDLNGCSSNIRREANWRYPVDMARRTVDLNLNWVTYEELFDHMPHPIEAFQSEIYSELSSFWERYGRRSRV